MVAFFIGMQSILFPGCHFRSDWKNGGIPNGQTIQFRASLTPHSLPSSVAFWVSMIPKCHEISTGPDNLLVWAWIFSSCFPQNSRSPSWVAAYRPVRLSPRVLKKARLTVSQGSRYAQGRGRAEWARFLVEIRRASSAIRGADSGQSRNRTAIRCLGSYSIHSGPGLGLES